jgi:hypothetical protein
MYHDLSGIRDTYGDDLVDKIIQFQRDPEQWVAEDLQQAARRPAAEADRPDQLRRLGRAADLMDRKHISPGRDLARLVLPEGADTRGVHRDLRHARRRLHLVRRPDADPGQGARGDPHVRRARPGHRVGRHVRRRRAAVGRRVPYLANKRAGVQGTRPGGHRGAAARRPGHRPPVTTVGKAWARYLEDAAKLRAAHARGTEAKTGSAKPRRSPSAPGSTGRWTSYGPLMGMLDEINGTRVISEAERGVPARGGALPRRAATRAPRSTTLTWAGSAPSRARAGSTAGST